MKKLLGSLTDSFLSMAEGFCDVAGGFFGRQIRRFRRGLPGLCGITGDAVGAAARAGVAARAALRPQAPFQPPPRALNRSTVAVRRAWRFWTQATVASLAVRWALSTSR